MELDLIDNKAICPKCDRIDSTLEGIKEYISVIYFNYKCICGYQWSRLFHYIGIWDKLEEQNEAVIKLLDKEIPELKDKVLNFKILKLEMGRHEKT